jgi:hypothetical protein
METASRASDLAPVNKPEAPAESDQTSVSAVVYEGAIIFSGMHIGEDVATSSLISEMLPKKDGDEPAPKMSPIGMQSMCNNTVVNPGAMYGWYRMLLQVALILSLCKSRSESGYC